MQQDITAASDNKRPHRRRQLVISASLQWKSAAWLMMVVFAACATLGVLLLCILQPFVRAGIMDPAGHHLLKAVLVLIAFAIGFAAVAATSFGVWGAMTTQRICGPLRVISGHLSELRAGRFPQCRPLQRTDELKEFYDEFSQTVAALQARNTELLTALQSVLVQASASAKDNAEEAGNAKRVSDSVAALCDELAKADLSALQARQMCDEGLSNGAWRCAAYISDAQS